MRKRNQKGRKLSVPILVWLVCSFALMFANVDFGLLLLLIGGVVLLFRFALRKDREIAQRRKAKKAASNDFKAVQSATPAPRSSVGVSVEYVGPEAGERVSVKVAGVTFANGRRQRQTILREIYWKDKAYSGPVRVTLRLSEFEGKKSVEVWANDEQIGFVPKAQTDYFLENWNRLVECKGLRVYGGGKRETGEEISFGASFIAVFE